MTKNKVYLYSYSEKKLKKNFIDANDNAETAAEKTKKIVLLFLYSFNKFIRAIKLLLSNSLKQIK